MAVSKKAKELYTGFFDGIETFAANLISDFLEEKYLHKYLDKNARLTSDQEKQIKEFWAPYCNVSPKWALYYSSKNGLFDPRYIPNTLYYTKIDQHFNDRKLGYGFNDKNYYSRLFPEVKQPDTIVRKIGKGIICDDIYKQISIDEAVERIKAVPEVIIKPSQESGSGRGIQFLKNEQTSEIRKFLEDKNDNNYIIQGIVKQHPTLEQVHAGSLNTIRVCTLLLEDGVHILSAVLRMGVDKSRIDNVTAGGISAAIKAGGVLDKYAYTYYTGERFERHPQGLKFEGYKVPAYDKIIETVKQLAQTIGNFRLVSWDMGVDAEGDVILVEANMRKGGINLHQFDNGPLFGELTERVLGEVFGK